MMNNSTKLEQISELTKNFFVYAFTRYLDVRSSIFIDGLVGGMFLSFLLDTEHRCQDRTFTRVFFIIGILHFLSKIAGNLVEYSHKVASMDNTETSLERRAALFCILVQHLVKVSQFPMVIWLGSYVVQFHFGEWVFDRGNVKPRGAKSKTCQVCYCDEIYVHLATLVVVFQFFYGLVTLLSWVVMWFVAGHDDAKEEGEERRWKEEDKEMIPTTVLGKIKDVAIIIGLHALFNESVAATMTGLAVALPVTSCNIHVTLCFLYAGIVHTLTDVLTQLILDVEDMAANDGVINKWENRVIVFLKLCKLPLFVIELGDYYIIVYKTISHFGDVIHDKKLAEEKDEMHHYCELGTWHLMVAVSIIYGLVLVFRVLVIVGDVLGVSRSWSRRQ